MTHALKVNGLRKNFGGLAVTNDVSFSLSSGSRTALIGPNGAGKTTLINLLSGLLKPEEGEIYLSGRDVTHVSATERVALGLVRSFQVTRLFSDMTVIEHVIISVLAMKKQMGGMWRPLTSHVEAVEQAKYLLNRLGIQSLSNLRVSEIAYGQQRLVEIAIALALNPKVLLLDEPAAGIPRDGMDMVLAALEDLPDDLAVLMIDHDMDLVRRFAKDIIVLAAGQVITSGDPEKISSDPRVRSVYLGV